MFVVRPVTLNDLDAYEKLAFTASVGITNLPKNRALLRQKIEASLNSFAQDTTTPKNEMYLFVLEDTATGELGGTCGIYSKTAVAAPSYFYKIETLTPHATTLPTPKKIEILRRISHRNGPSEICGLFLRREFRKEGLGKLLSFSRFLFIASHPRRFDRTVVSEMRGAINKKKSSQFWEGLGKHFLNIPFHELFPLLEKDPHFIGEFLPEYPIYTSLLSPQTQRAIGQPHRNTRPALEMLYKEGFSFTGEIDVCDGGPKISAKTHNIATIKNSRTGTIKEISTTPIKSKRFIISNNALHFHACYGPLHIRKNRQVVISNETAHALHLNIGDTIRYV